MTSPVTITLVLNLKPEAAGAFCAALPNMLKETKQFAGFRSIRVMRNKTHADQVIFIEEWSSEEDYMKYIAWRTETGAMTNLASALVSPPKMEVWPTLIAS
jgi:quinol monooxygenase YgiN